MSGKYTSFFRENYHCNALKHSSAKKVGDRIIVEGSCDCLKHKDATRVCSWKHTIDAKGNVVSSQETGCPCPNPAIKVKHHKTEHGIKTGKAIAIGFSVLGGIVLIIGIIYLVRRHN